MATITSEVFRFINLRAPAKQAITTAPTTGIPKSIPIGRVMSNPDGITEQEWNDTLVQKMLSAKNDSANAGNQRAAMFEVLQNDELKDLPSDTALYQNQIAQNVLGIADWIDTNKSTLDKTTLRDKLIETINLIRTEEAPITSSTLSELTTSADFVKTELKLWDVLTISTLYLKRPRLAEGAVRALKLLHLGKAIADFDTFPSESEAIYQIFDAPIDFPSEIFPLPLEVKKRDEQKPTEESVSDEEIKKVKEDYARLLFANEALTFLKEYLREDYAQKLAGFKLIYDEHGVPTNLDLQPQRNFDILTKDDILDVTANSCDDNISNDLQSGLDFISEGFFCGNKAKVSFSYIEREIEKNIRKKIQKLEQYEPGKTIKTVMINGTIMTYHEVVAPRIK